MREMQSSMTGRSSSRSVRAFVGTRPRPARRVPARGAPPQHEARSAAEQDSWTLRDAASRGLALLLAGSQATAAALAVQLAVAAGPAPAVLVSPNARIPRTVDAALRRWGAPARPPPAASARLNPGPGTACRHTPAMPQPAGSP